MDIIFLILVILGVAAQNTSKRMYADKAGGENVYFYGMVASVFSALSFVIFSLGKFSFTAQVLPYSFIYGLCFVLCTYSFTKAVSCGPLSLSSLVISYSLMLPTVYGIIFFGEKVSPCFYVGIALLAVSLALINVNGKNAAEDTKISAKWLIAAVVSLLSNGVLTIVANVQQKDFNGMYKSEFMIPGLLMAATVFAIMFVLKERKNAKALLKKGSFSAAFGGVSHFATNVSILFLVALMPASLLFPLVGAGGIIVTFFISTFIYREKLSRAQLIGFVMGVASVVFLSI